MASNRPSHITSLSGKVQGLKFMQRAKAPSRTATDSPQNDQSSASNEPIDSSKQSMSFTDDPNAQSFPSSEQNDINDEHWILPSSTSVSTTPSKSNISVEPQPGWNAFLSAASSSSQNPDGETSTANSSFRRAFGSWVEKRGKRKQEESSDAKDGEAEYEMSSGLDSEESDLSSSEGQQEASNRQPVTKGKGFLKPGTLEASKRAREEVPRERGARKCSTSTSKDVHGHQKAREEAATKKRIDMGGAKAAKRKKAGFYVPRPDQASDSDGDDDESLTGFEELEGNASKEQKGPMKPKRQLENESKVSPKKALNLNGTAESKGKKKTKKKKAAKGSRKKD